MKFNLKGVIVSSRKPTSPLYGDKNERIVVDETGFVIGRVHINSKLSYTPNMYKNKSISKKLKNNNQPILDLFPEECNGRKPTKPLNSVFIHKIKS